MQQRRITKTAVSSQKAKHELRISEALSVVTILVVDTGEFWDKLVCLQAESTYVLGMCDGVLT